VNMKTRIAVQITEVELVLFHQGALPLREILPFLRQDEPLSHRHERCQREWRWWRSARHPRSESDKLED
jgi:hypothetical protein